jgi:c-di-GMP-binding flagellar brake protein YcgR
MPSIYEAELQNWHDYEVTSRREIVALLKSIGEKKQLIRMLVQGEADVSVTSILDIDADAGLVVLDCAVSNAQNQRALAARQISFETTLDKIRILFAADALQTFAYQGSPAFSMPIPDSLIRLQRREYYRMPTPVSNPVRALIPLPAELGGALQAFPLADISCGGIAILDNKLQLGETTIGSQFENVKIELPEIGTVVTGLQIRNSMNITLLNNKTNRRLGCEFVGISRGNMANVQKYITKLERERNARIAGLG